MEGVLNEIMNSYHSQPLFTRSYISMCMVVSLLVQLNLISTYHIFYTVEEAFIKLNLWRPITAFLFIQKITIFLFVSLSLLYLSLSSIEIQITSGKKYAQFLWMIGLLLFYCILVGSFINLYFFTDIFIVAIAYIFSERSKIKTFSFFSAFTIQNRFLAYFYLIAMLFYRREAFTKQFLSQIIGLLFAYLYVYLQKTEEKENRKFAILSPPTSLINICKKYVQNHRKQKY